MHLHVGPLIIEIDRQAGEWFASFDGAPSLPISSGPLPIGVAASYEAGPEGTLNGPRRDVSMLSVALRWGRIDGRWKPASAMGNTSILRTGAIYCAPSNARAVKQGAINCARTHSVTLPALKG